MRRLWMLLLCALLAAGLAAPIGAVDHGGDSDTTPPVLRDIYLEGGRCLPGEAIALYAVAEDDDSGVESVKARFVHQATGKKLTATLFDEEWSGNGRRWAGAVRVPKTADLGEYRLEQVTVYDMAGNRAVYRLNVSADGKTFSRLQQNVRFTVAANCTAAVLEGCKAELRGTTVTVTLSASGLDSGSVLFENAATGRKFTLSLGEDDKTGTGTYRRQHRLSEYEPQGTFSLKQVTLTGENGSKTTYILDPDEEKQDQVPLTASAFFTVSNTKSDTEPPRLLDMRLGNRTRDGDKEAYLYPVTVRAVDDGSGIDHITVTFKNHTTGETVSKVLREADRTGDDRYAGDLKVDLDADRGLWELDSIAAYDMVGNRMTWCRPEDLKADDDNKTALTISASFTK